MKLLPEDDAGFLQSLGLPLLKAGSRQAGSPRGAGKTWSFSQPCAALEGCRCRIYESRPCHCRQFKCLLLEKVERGGATEAEALRVIRSTRRQAEKVRRLLRALGDKDETVALAERFRRMTRRLQRETVNDANAALYSELTLAFHDLTVLIHEAFYRPPREQ